ncbi:MAG: PilN domain-containing protein [Nitrosomonadales bacterium]|jgi:Tfp pilus assembly protein PilN
MSQQINLFNPEFLKQETHFTLVTMLQGLAAIFVGALILYGYALYQVRELDKQAAQVLVRLNAEQSALAGYSAGFSPQKNNELLQNELLQLEKKAGEVKSLTDTLREGQVSNTTGFSDYLRAFSRQVVPGLWLTGFKVSAAEITLSGGALAPESVPAYIQKLSHESIMHGKSFSNLQIQPAKDAKHLEFTLFTAPDSQP